MVSRWAALKGDRTFEGEYELVAGLILGLRPANERRRLKVAPSLIGWMQT